jgi:outer membrane receptor protein involved in Fe transport
MFGFDWSATGSYVYTGEQWMNPFNDPLYDKVGSWDRWDVRLNAAPGDRAWEVTAFIKNITDDRQIITLGRPSTVTQNAQTTLTDPRIYGLRFDYYF